MADEPDPSKDNRKEGGQPPQRTQNNNSNNGNNRQDQQRQPATAVRSDSDPYEDPLNAQATPAAAPTGAASRTVVIDQGHNRTVAVPATTRAQATRTQMNPIISENSVANNRFPVLIFMRRNNEGSNINSMLNPLRRSSLSYTPMPLGRESTFLLCPACRQRILTMVIMEPKHPRCLITFLLLTLPCCCCMSWNKPPPYTENQPGFTPASYYQPGGQSQQPPLYPPMPQGQQPMPPPPQQSTVIIQTRPQLIPLGNQPSRVTCPSCHAEILTTVKHQPSSRTHCWAIVLCLFICWPCVCLPYCMDSCQNANHYCPNCNAYVGTFEN